MTVELPAEGLGIAGAPVRAQIEEELETNVADLRAQGIEASWEATREGDLLRYLVHAQGEGYDALRQVAFEDADIFVEEVDGREAIHFRAFVPQEIMLGGETTITLVGSEIISTNGNRVDEGTVQWVNPAGRLEAVLVGNSRFAANPLLLPAALLAGAVVVLGGGYLVWSRTRGSRYCTQCGTPLAPDARFCSGCGQRIT